MPNFDRGRVRLGTFGACSKKGFLAGRGRVEDRTGFLGRPTLTSIQNLVFSRRPRQQRRDPTSATREITGGSNTQYLHPCGVFGHAALLTVGSNFHDNQINVGLNHTREREFLDAMTSAHAHVTNVAGYFQQGVDLLQQRLHIDAGLRFDYFRFDVNDLLVPANSGVQGASRFQPKANISYTPSLRVPLTLYASYGRGISSQDARGVVQRPDAPKVSTTDFYQVGTSHNLKRFSLRNGRIPSSTARMNRSTSPTMAASNSKGQAGRMAGKQKLLFRFCAICPSMADSPKS